MTKDEIRKDLAFRLGAGSIVNPATMGHWKALVTRQLPQGVDPMTNVAEFGNWYWKQFLALESTFAVHEIVMTKHSWKVMGNSILIKISGRGPQERA